MKQSIFLSIVALVISTQAFATASQDNLNSALQNSLKNPHTNSSRPTASHFYGGKNLTQKNTINTLPASKHIA